MGRFREKLTAAFPRSSITGIDYPKALPREKFRQRLLAGNRRHPVTQNDQLLFLGSSGCRQKFRNDLSLESGSEHTLHYLLTGRREACPRFPLGLTNLEQLPPKDSPCYDRCYGSDRRLDCAIISQPANRRRSCTMDSALGRRSGIGATLFPRALKEACYASVAHVSCHRSSLIDRGG